MNNPEGTPTPPEIKTPEVSIVPARAEDAAEIIELKNRTWLDTYPNEELGITAKDILLRTEGVNGEIREKGIERWRELIQRQGITSMVYVARAGSKITGIVAPSLINGQRRVGALYVAPEKQGQGIGSQLLAKAIEWHGRTDDIYLHVATYNHQAIEFYKSFGFKETGNPIEDVAAARGGTISIPELEMVLTRLN